MFFQCLRFHGRKTYYWLKYAPTTASSDRAKRLLLYFDRTLKNTHRAILKLLLHIQKNTSANWKDVVLKHVQVHKQDLGYEHL